MSQYPRLAALALILVLMVNTAPALAGNTLLSGAFHGAEPAIVSLSGYESCQYPLGYQQTIFRVSASGSYDLNDALDNLWGYGAVGVYARVYQGSFNPAAPGQNVMNPVDYWRYTFSSDATYVLVVQQGCGKPEGPWAIWFVGPGSVSSDSVVQVPDFTNGNFAANDPTMVSGCGSGDRSAYHQSGPVRVSRDGTYYFSDTSMKWSVVVCLQVYTEPVDPADPAANRVGSAIYGQQRINLKAGQDYYFVTQNVGGQKTGDYLFVLAPPAPFQINPGLAGSWHNPENPGQGFFLTVYEKTNQVFLAWFTYASGPPAGDESDHRWMTALGNFEGTSAELDIESTTGGVFDSAHPVPEQNADGSLQLDFTDCTSGQVSYNRGGGTSGSPVVSGVIPIKRLANDSVALCESLYAGPGMPGPL